MKTYTGIFILLLAIASCNTRQPDKEPAKADSVSITINKDSASIHSDTHYFWEADIEQTGLVMKKTRPASADSLNATNMVEMLNSLHPDILLAYLKTSTDTLFLKIKNSHYLSQRIGSSGAEAYLAEVIYNFTELNGISYVDLQFTEGDHAAPGTYSRTDFVK